MMLYALTNDHHGLPTKEYMIMFPIILNAAPGMGGKKIWEIASLIQCHHKLYIPSNV